jgi:hypothetical protein
MTRGSYIGQVWLSREVVTRMGGLITAHYAITFPLQVHVKTSGIKGRKAKGEVMIIWFSFCLDGLLQISGLEGQA